MNAKMADASKEPIIVDLPISVLQCTPAEARKMQALLPRRGRKPDPKIVAEFAEATLEDGRYDIMKIRPESLFIDVTDVWSAEAKIGIEKRCIRDLYMAYVSPLRDEPNRLVWWRLEKLGKDGWIREKGDLGTLVARDERPATPLLEAEMEKAFIRHLKNKGRKPARQVTCEVGIADVVDETYCYELKVLRGSSSALFGAVGQACLYAKCLNKKPAVVLNAYPGEEFAWAIREMGVRLEVFRP